MPTELPDQFQGGLRSTLSGGPFLPDKGIDFAHVVNEFENHLILQALEKSGWVKNRAARLLSLNRTTLVEKIKKKKISKEMNLVKIGEV